MKEEDEDEDEDKRWKRTTRRKRSWWQRFENNDLNEQKLIFGSRFQSYQSMVTWLCCLEHHGGKHVAEKSCSSGCRQEGEGGKDQTRGWWRVTVPKDTVPWSTPSPRPHLCSLHHLPIKSSSYDSITGLIHQRSQSPCDLITFQKPQPWKLLLGEQPFNISIFWGPVRVQTITLFSAASIPNLVKKFHHLIISCS